MKKICLSVVGLYLGLFGAFAQTKTTDSVYESRPLKIDEINLVSSYYHQDGNNSAVTGGIGTEKLTDIANVIDLKLVGYDYKLRKHSVTIEAGVDTYTSASSDKIDLKANSSASSHDVRFYPSLAWSVENEKTGNTFGLNASFSKEFDYTSFGIGASFNKKSKNNNREFGIKAQAYLDRVSLIYPTELIPATSSASSSHGEHHYPVSARNTFSTSLSYSQVVNKNFQLMFLTDLVSQNGYLGLPFHRVYFTDGSVHVENLPGNRFKVPLGVRANYFLGDKVILRSFYRFYKDNWGLQSNTIDLETAVKLTPFFSVTPFYRFYTQTAIKYYAAYEAHTVADQYYTSSPDLSKFNSNFFGAGFRVAPPKGVLGIERLSMLELRYGHYSRTNGLNSDIVSLNLKFK
ncbi:DUF3570 domain-containing protein [Ferruginibacter sp. SUN106]|uniref:DUF3570 domain-containing protein n=1 Tax=Ferruginibacter sp. SUN106 TaxID=2978348 RepID=UPI003D35E6FE